MARRSTLRGPAAPRGEVREKLRLAAKELFSDHDFSRVTVRAIAERAGCDPGLVSYYFGSKAGIFREAMSLPSDPVQLISATFGDGRQGTGERVLLAIMDLWEQSEVNANFRVMVSSMLSSEGSLQMFRAWIDADLMRPLLERMPTPDRRLRLELAFSQVLGLVATRYVYRMEPLVSTPRAQLATIYGPMIDVTLGNIGRR